SECGRGGGVRRIEGLRGKGGLLDVEEIEREFNNIKNDLKVKSHNQLLQKLKQLQQQQKPLLKQLQQPNKQ
ncbi:hypothetical protein, partial [Staphylococcus epidermidis]|uniref:hypothetical protein n=1 Tax=Staphylococcus epidermidis TaxID=1282 RepID=UPI00164351EA